MSEREVKSEMLFTRVTPEVKRLFVEKAEPFGGASDLIRELVMALIEGRVTVSPPAHMKEFYREP